MNAIIKTKKVKIGKDSTLYAAVKHFCQQTTSVATFSKVFEQDLGIQLNGDETNFSFLRILSQELLGEYEYYNNQGLPYPLPLDEEELLDFNHACHALKNIAEGQEITLQDLEKIRGAISTLTKIQNSSHDYMLSAERGLEQTEEDIKTLTQQPLRKTNVKVTQFPKNRTQKAEEDLPSQKCLAETEAMIELRGNRDIFSQMENKYRLLQEAISILMPDLNAISHAARYLAIVNDMAKPANINAAL